MEELHQLRHSLILAGAEGLVCVDVLLLGGMQEEVQSYMLVPVSLQKDLSILAKQAAILVKQHFATHVAGFPDGKQWPLDVSVVTDVKLEAVCWEWEVEFVSGQGCLDIFGCAHHGDAVVSAASVGAWRGLTTKIIAGPRVHRNCRFLFIITKDLTVVVCGNGGCCVCRWECEVGAVNDAQCHHLVHNSVALHHVLVSGAGSQCHQRRLHHCQNYNCLCHSSDLMQA